MKWKNLLTNKKIVIISFAVLLALIIVIFALNSSVEKEHNDYDSITEQDGDGTEPKEDIDGQDKNKDDYNVIQPNQTVPENSSDASGNWDALTGSQSQSGDESNTNKSEANEEDKKDEDKKDEDKKDEDKKDEDKKDEDKKDEHAVKDEIQWGEIY